MFSSVATNFGLSTILCLVLFLFRTLFSPVKHCDHLGWGRELDPVVQRKKISNYQELMQSDPTSCPQNLKGNN